MTQIVLKMESATDLSCKRKGQEPGERWKLNKRTESRQDEVYASVPAKVKSLPPWRFLPGDGSMESQNMFAQ